MRAYAKVNIFLKITGVRGNYHEIISRFMLVKNLYDDLEFVKKDSKDFKIIGEFDCSVEQNTIYKAYKALHKYTDSDKLEKFMQNYAVKVEKKIPSFAGLGGGSSDAATYLLMCNDELALGLSKDELAKIGAEVGADVAFFVYGYDSANVSGIGEIVEEFNEELLNIETFTPKIEISTPAVYKEYRDSFFNLTKESEVAWLKEATSKEVLKKYSMQEANDLFAPALSCYGELKEYVKDGWFFSGSGSSFFRVKE